jgi:hypothetical protein
MLGQNMKDMFILLVTLVAAHACAEQTNVVSILPVAPKSEFTLPIVVHSSSSATVGVAVVSGTPKSVSTPEEANLSLGQLVTVVGTAKHTKGGRPWVVDTQFQAACEGFPSWPAGVLDRQVQVTGFVAKHYVVDEYAGAGKTWYIMTECRYELVKP